MTSSLKKEPDSTFWVVRIPNGSEETAGKHFICGTWRDVDLGRGWDGVQEMRGWLQAFQLGLKVLINVNWGRSGYWTSSEEGLELTSWCSLIVRPGLLSWPGLLAYLAWAFPSRLLTFPPTFVVHLQLHIRLRYSFSFSSSLSIGSTLLHQLILLCVQLPRTQ